MKKTKTSEVFVFFGSIIVGKSLVRFIMQSDKTVIRNNLMKQFNFITSLLGIKDRNITILDYVDTGTHKEIIAWINFPIVNTR